MPDNTFEWGYYYTLGSATAYMLKEVLSVSAEPYKAFWKIVEQEEAVWDEVARFYIFPDGVHARMQVYDLDGLDVAVIYGPPVLPKHRTVGIPGSGM